MKTYYPKSVVHILIIVLIVSLYVSCQSSYSVMVKPVKDINGEEISVTKMENGILAVMKKASVAGLSCTIINDLEIVYSQSFGYKNAESESPLDKDSVFAAASFSKSVFAYLVVSLAKEGYLDLDTPLVEYLSSPISDYPRFADLADDERHKGITARQVLSHSTGLPNSRIFMPEAKLGFMFNPGEMFSYSAEGFEFLQLVVEEIMGKGIEELSQEKIVKPFGMKRTSFDWLDEFEEDHALPHNKWMKPHFFRHRSPSAAGSMVTTSADFAKFIIGALKERDNERDAISQMFDTQVAINSESMFGPGAWRESEASKKINLAWGLGWGMYDSDHGRAYFRTGHGNGAQNYTVFFPDTGTGIVLLSNSDNFESVAAEIIELILNDSSSPYEWLGYNPFDPANVTPPPEERNSVSVDAEILKEYAGTYMMEDYDLTYIKVEGDKLFYSSNNKNWERMFAESSTKFYFKNFPYIYEFVRNKNNQVTQLDIVIEEYNIRMAAKRRNSY